MSRQVLLMLIGIGVIIIIVALALIQIGSSGEPDLQATREQSTTSCADLYQVGSQAYKLCLDG